MAKSEQGGAGWSGESFSPDVSPQGCYGPYVLHIYTPGLRSTGSSPVLLGRLPALSLHRDPEAFRAKGLFLTFTHICPNNPSALESGVPQAARPFFPLTHQPSNPPLPLGTLLPGNRTSAQPKLGKTHLLEALLSGRRGERERERGAVWGAGRAPLRLRAQPYNPTEKSLLLVARHSSEPMASLKPSPEPLICTVQRSWRRSKPSRSHLPNQLH